jgi:hypothetical protein
VSRDDWLFVAVCVAVVAGLGYLLLLAIPNP